MPGIFSCLLLNACLGAVDERPEAIYLPVVEACEESPTGLKTTWSCVWFGRYPFTEVADDSRACVDDYALQVTRVEDVSSSLPPRDEKEAGSSNPN